MVINIKSGEVLATYNHYSGIHLLSWSSDDRSLAYSGIDHVVHVENLIGAKRTLTIDSGTTVTSLSWSPVRRNLAVAAGTSVDVYQVEP